MGWILPPIRTLLVKRSVPRVVAKATTAPIAKPRDRITTMCHIMGRMKGSAFQAMRPMRLRPKSGVWVGSARARERSRGVVVLAKSVKQGTQYRRGRGYRAR